MKKKIDYRNLYKLEGKNVALEDVTLRQAVSQAMDHSTPLGNYHIRRREASDLIVFGRDETSQIEMDSSNVLLISRHQEPNWDVPELVLRYGIYPREIVVGYIQTPYDVSFEDYRRMKSNLEVRPHDLILAHFLDRISPVLNKFPDTNVFFSPIYLDKPVYPLLRDRFLDGDYLLNPNRTRVQQIMGRENSWMRKDNVQKRSLAQYQIKRRLTYKDRFFDLFV